LWGFLETSPKNNLFTQQGDSHGHWQSKPFVDPMTNQSSD
jgi:hypothetical protein